MEVVNKRDKDISWIFRWVIAGFILSFIDIKFEIISSIISLISGLFFYLAIRMIKDINRSFRFAYYFALVFIIVNMLDLVLKATPYQAFALKYILIFIGISRILFMIRGFYDFLEDKHHIKRILIYYLISLLIAFLAYLLGIKASWLLVVIIMGCFILMIYHFEKMKKTIIFITHDLNEAIKLGDRIAIMRDGEIVQVGTSEEILTEPANDYVARFVENVDRSKIVTAGSIMITRPAVARLRKEGPEVLIRKMKERDITVRPVIDENDKLIGEITLEDAAILRHKGIKSIKTAILSEVHSVTEDTKIEDLLPLITKTNSPIYVVDEERELKGLIPLSSIVVEMTGKDKNEINELIQNAIEL